MEKKITVSIPGTPHVQGIAVDNERKHLYVSFTTALVKTDMQGNILGSVRGLAGHLGCIAFNSKDGRVYGSLEYKNDAIGNGILKRTALKTVEDGFYIAIFDVDKIDRIDMDAEQDGVMTAVFLREAFEDYAAPGHRFGCSGIDGITFAPPVGGFAGQYLYVAYGIYGDTTRCDNDHQIILCYDVEELRQWEAPLNQRQMHRNGPDQPQHKYFVFTGNTTYGIQNLEYDPYTKRFLVAVYRGKKPQYPNYPMFMIDAQRPAKSRPLAGVGMEGEMMTLIELENGECGFDFPYGATGMVSLGDGYYYFSHDWKNPETGDHGTDVMLYRWDADAAFVLI